MKKYLAHVIVRHNGVPLGDWFVVCSSPGVAGEYVRETEGLGEQVEVSSRFIGKLVVPEPEMRIVAREV